MPHVIIYSHYNNLGTGPTYVANRDELLLDYLVAQRPNSSHQVILFAKFSLCQLIELWLDSVSFSRIPW